MDEAALIEKLNRNKDGDNIELNENEQKIMRKLLL